MIFVASLSRKAKKALGDEVYQTSPSVIAKNLKLDRQISEMDLAIIHPDDLSGLKNGELVEALGHVHPTCKVLYIFSSEKDRDLAPQAMGIYKHQVKRIIAEIIRDLAHKVLENTKVTSVEEVDFTDELHEELAKVSEINEKEKIKEAALIDRISVTAKDVSEEELNKEEQQETSEQPTVEDETTIEKLSLSEATPEETEREESINIKNREAEMLEPKRDLDPPIVGENMYPDWDAIKERLSMENMMRDLLSENTKYCILTEDILYLEKRIEAIFLDESKPHEEKIKEIKSIALKKSAKVGDAEDILTDKILSVISMVTNTIEKTMDTRLNEIQKNLDKVASLKLLNKEEDVINALINERYDLYQELRSEYVKLVQTYKIVDSTVADFLESLDKDIPTSSEYINELFRPIKQLFIPQNLDTLISKVKESMANNSSSFSTIEDRMKAIISLLFKLCDSSMEIINHQQNLIELYKTRRPEERVRMENVLKGRLKIFIGCEGSGVSSTGSIYAHNRSRVKNVALIDLRTKVLRTKFKNYVDDLYDLDTFLNLNEQGDFIEKIQKEFVAVKGEVPEYEKLVESLSVHTDYYGEIVILLDDTQVDLLNYLSGFALTTYFVVGNHKQDLLKMKRIIQGYKATNIAKRIVFVAPPLDELRMMNMLEADKLIFISMGIPYISEIVEYSLRGIPPYRSEVAKEVFRGVFE